MTGPAARRSTEERLAEAEALIAALRSGAVDGLVDGAAVVPLEGAEAFFRTLVSTMPDGAASLDAGGTILYANPRFVALAGQPAQGVVGRRLDEVVAPGQDDEVRHLLAADGGPTRARLRMRGGVAVTAAAARFGGGRDELCVVISDLTDRENAQRAEERFQSAFEQAPLGMALVTLDGRVERVNEVLADLLGRPPGDVAGMSLSGLLDTSRNEALPRRLHALRDGSAERHHAEVRYRDHAGQTVWAAESASLVRDDAGEPSHLLLHVEDLRARREVEYLANHDAVTGLLNRRAFELEIGKHLARVGRYGAAGALVVLDLDGFKLVNDTLGHAAGDQLLQHVAAALVERLRESDLLARLGGDEFAVLVPRGDTIAVEIVAEAIRETIADIAGPDGRPVAASVGVAMCDDGAITTEELLVRADMAMYDAKQAGRDRLAFYTPRGDEQRTALAYGRLKQIEESIAAGRLALFAQPIVDLADGEVRHYELLVRMFRPDGGLIEAAEFIPVAERYGLVGSIDRWVLGRAFELLEQDVPHGAGLSVNISAKSLDEDTVGWLEGRLGDGGADPRRLTVELTETAAIASLRAGRRFAQRLRTLGVALALDDFGVGFGSFTYLRRIPFDVLKIDGQFVRSCATEPRDRALVEGLARIASSLGKRTVAEFVRDAATVEVLRELGVDMGQGFHLGRPGPAEDLLT